MLRVQEGKVITLGLMVHRVLTQACLVVRLKFVSTVAGAVIGTNGVDAHLGADGT